jgi:hypothetical protein
MAVTRRAWEWVSDEGRVVDENGCPVILSESDCETSADYPQLNQNLPDVVAAVNACHVFAVAPADLEPKVAALVAAVVHCVDVMELADRHADTHPLLLVEVSQVAWRETFIAPLVAAVTPFKEATDA